MAGAGGRPALDLIFHPDGPYDSIEQLRPLYREFGRPEDIDVFSFDASHRYTKTSRQAVFAWMLTHVAGGPAAGDAHTTAGWFRSGIGDRGSALARGLRATGWPDYTNTHPVTGSRALVDVRGVGDTGWGSGQTLHLRRAATLVGRTIAGLRIWDTLCALDALEQLTGGAEVILRGEGDLAVVALFAAVLDERIAWVELADLPATLDAPSDPSGREDLIEVLHALRVADIPDLLELVEATFLDPAPRPRT